MRTSGAAREDRIGNSGSSSTADETRENGPRRFGRVTGKRGNERSKGGYECDRD